MTLEGPACLRMGRGYQEGSGSVSSEPQFAVCDEQANSLQPSVVGSS